MVDRCICCGEIIPEGRQVCLKCGASQKSGRLCPVCREFKPLSEYGKRLRRGKNIGQAYCIPCKRIIDKNNKRTKREMEK